MSSWNQDNRAAQQLAMAKKAAAKTEPRESWWAQPGLSRAAFQQKLAERHQQIPNKRVQRLAIDQQSDLRRH